MAEYPQLPDDDLEMAAPDVNWSLFLSKIENIKSYYGDSNTINSFISRCDCLVNSYLVLNNPEINEHIFNCIQNKLIGRAEQLVGNRTELNTWEALKTALKQYFSDRKHLDCLLQELTRTRPNKEEDI